MRMTQDLISKLSIEMKRDEYQQDNKQTLARL